MVHYVTSLNPKKAEVEELMGRINDYYNNDRSIGISESINTVESTARIPAVDNDLILLNNSWQIREPQVIRNPGLKGTIKWHIKKSILKIVHKYITDLFSEQENFNANVVRCINSLQAEMNRKK